MALKYTYNEVKEYIELYGCKLISSEYINVKKNLSILGSCGHEYSISFDRFKNKEQYNCRNCGLKRGAEKRKFSYDEVFEYIKSKNCLLLDNVYTKNEDDLKIKFSCGHIGKRSFANFKICNPVCFDCSGIKKYEKSEAIDYLSKNNYFYIDGEYKDVFSKINVIDNFGYKYLTSYSQVRTNLQNGHRIREFDIRNPFSLDNIKNWITKNNKNFILLDKEYNGKEFKMSWKCTNSNCGETFITHWATILRGSGCSYCSSPAKQVGQKNNLKYKFPELAIEFDEKKNGISASLVLGGSSKEYFWNCPNCKKSYLLTAGKRTNGIGCPECCESKGEKAVRSFLKKSKIKFAPQYKFNDCIDTRCLPFDFYLKKFNCAIEYNGKQHYESCSFFGGLKQFEIRQYHDQIKRDYCSTNNIKLIEISYKDYKNIEQILTKELNLETEPNSNANLNLIQFLTLSRKEA
jgi:hypothetical protein